MPKAATQSEKERMDAIGRGWCVPCMIKQQQRPATVQHVTEGGRRLGHRYTYGSCPWHHQAVNEPGYSTQEMIGLLGPSFAHGRRFFESIYGDERDVLVRLQDWILVEGDECYHHELYSQWDALRRAN